MLKKFIIYCIYFFIPIVIFTATYFIIYNYYNKLLNKSEPGKSVYIWGDSQMKAGINLQLLSEIARKDVLSSADGGAGVYDFLVFAELVPDSSQIILSISDLAQLRSVDRNRAGIPIKFLLNLLKSDFKGLFPALRNNLLPERIFYSNSVLYPTKDSITYHEPITKFSKIYSQNTAQLENRQSLYIDGIKYLISKKCKITMIEFPFDKNMKEILENSQSRKKVEEFNLIINSLFKLNHICFLKLESDKRIMYDLTHMNENGADIFTKKLIQNWNLGEPDELTIIKLYY